MYSNFKQQRNQHNTQQICDIPSVATVDKRCGREDDGCSMIGADAPVVLVIQVCGAGEACCKVLLEARVSPEEAAEGVTEDSIPLCPHIPVGEAPHLVATNVPRLCYQLCLGQHWVFGDGAYERRRLQQLPSAVCTCTPTLQTEHTL